MLIRHVKFIHIRSLLFADLHKYQLVWWEAKWAQLFLGHLHSLITHAQHLWSLNHILSNDLRMPGRLSSHLHFLLVRLLPYPCKSSLTVCTRGSAMDFMSYFVSENLHHRAIHNIFYSPMSFFVRHTYLYCQSAWPNMPGVFSGYHCKEFRFFAMCVHADDSS